VSKRCEEVYGIADIMLVFFAAAGIIIIGFLGNIIFRKIGLPEILFLIITGILLGPVFNIFSKNDFLPVLPLISTFTLLMVLLRGGMELNIVEVVFGSLRALFQAAAYFLVGMVLIALFLHFLVGWDLIESFMFGSIVSQTGEVVIIPMAKKLGIHAESATLLSIEAVLTSIFNIVFFYAFLDARLGGALTLSNTLLSILSKFSVGIVVGAIMGILWLRALFFFGKEEFTYMATLAYVLLGYIVSETLSGSGAIAILALGIILGNDERILRTLRMSPSPPSFSEVKTYLMRFQREISVILRTFFFVLLGMMFDTSQSSIVLGLSYGLPVIGILLAARYAVVSVSTRKSPMAADKRIITSMCALGLTPALLTFIAVQYNLPDASLYTLLVTNMIIITNIITSLSAMVYRRTKPKEHPSHA